MTREDYDRIVDEVWEKYSLGCKTVMRREGFAAACGEVVLAVVKAIAKEEAK